MLNRLLILLIGIAFVGCNLFLKKNSEQVKEERDEYGKLISKTITTIYYYRPFNSHSRKKYKSVKYIYGGKDGTILVRKEKCIERPKKKIEKAIFE